MRRGRIFGGLATVFAAGAFMAPYALAQVGSTADEGYPCATQPPGMPGDTTTACTTTTPTTTPTTNTTTTTGTTTGTTTVTTTTTSTTPPPPATTTTPGGVAGAATTTTTSTPAGTPPSVLGAGKTIKGSPSPVLGAQHTSGTLPFTGLQLGVFVALGVLLIAGGLVLRASGRSSRAVS